ncbi:universal stress protein [Micropruina sp.]|uniref:universal stress protein n=1 Tax=Micropruina sp. TaxID=2737536 RepID=UPI0039E5D7CE
MTVLIGLTPNERGAGALALGAMAARSLHDDLVVASITAKPWPEVFGADREYLDLQRAQAEAALQQAGASIGNDLDVRYVVESGRSVASGLVEVARDCAASVVVLGSSSQGVDGLISLGGVASRLLNSLDVPVLIAPTNYHAAPDARVRRVSVGFGRGDRDSGLLTSAAVQAAKAGVQLRVACFAVRPMNAATGSIEADTEDLVVQEWIDGLRGDIEPALVEAVADPADVPIVVGVGGSWEQAITALEWAPNELLAVGASTSGVSRLLLGSHASKIVRNAPLPVLVLPRSD